MQSHAMGKLGGSPMIGLYVAVLALLATGRASGARGSGAEPAQNASSNACSSSGVAGPL